MYPKLFNIPFLNSYGLCVSIGLVLCFLVGRHYAKVKSMNREFAIFLEGNGYVAVVMGFVFGVLGQSLFIYLKDPSKGFHLTSSMTAITGLAGGAGVFIIGYFVYGRRRYGPRFIEVLPIAPACMVIAHACGRLGCFSAGCCYGQPTTSWLGLRFPHLDHAVVPTQLIEAGFLFLLFALLYHLAVRRDFKQTFVVYMVGYGLFRFCIEFIRGDERGALIGSLSPSQTLSLLLVAGSVGVYFLIARLVKDYETSTSLSNKIIPRPKTTPTSAISS